MRSLDFTVCTRVCSADCWRKLTKEEEDWLAVNPIFQSYSNFPDCKEYKYKEYEIDIPMIDEVENNNEPDYEDNLVFPPKSAETIIFWHTTSEELPEQRIINHGVNPKTNKPIISKIDDECLVVWKGKVKRSRYLTEQKRWEGYVEGQAPAYWVKLSEIEV